MWGWVGGVRLLQREELGCMGKGGLEEPGWGQVRGADESSTVGRASLELMFGSWCRGRRTAVSTQVGGGSDVTLPRRGWEKAP